jgi:hypothetical protein
MRTKTLDTTDAPGGNDRGCAALGDPRRDRRRQQLCQPGIERELAALDELEHRCGDGGLEHAPGAEAIIGIGSVAQGYTEQPIHYFDGNTPTNMPGHQIRGVAGLADFG